MFRRKRREQRQFMINRADHDRGGTRVELVPIRYDGIQSRALRAGEVVELVEERRIGRIHRRDLLEGEE